VRKRTLENNVEIKIYGVALEYRDQDGAVRRRTGVYAGVSCLPAEVVQGNGGRSAALRMTLLHELDSQPRQHRPTRPMELEHARVILLSLRRKLPCMVVQSSAFHFWAM
jgi:hypothetical protein